MQFTLQFTFSSGRLPAAHIKPTSQHIYTTWFSTSDLRTAPLPATGAANSRSGRRARNMLGRSKMHCSLKKESVNINAA